MIACFPQEQGLYRPAYEHDACGIGFVANIRGEPSHDIIRRGLEVLERMAHRGAEGADNCTGDGAGIRTISATHEICSVPPRLRRWPATYAIYRPMTHGCNAWERSPWKATSSLQASRPPTRSAASTSSRPTVWLNLLRPTAMSAANSAARRYPATIRGTVEQSWSIEEARRTA